MQEVQRTLRTKEYEENYFNAIKFLKIKNKRRYFKKPEKRIQENKYMRTKGKNEIELLMKTM